MARKALCCRRLPRPTIHPKYPLLPMTCEKATFKGNEARLGPGKNICRSRESRTSRGGAQSHEWVRPTVGYAGDADVGSGGYIPQTFSQTHDKGSRLL